MIMSQMFVIISSIEGGPMPKICPNLSVIVEIINTRLMSLHRRDITVDREGTTV